jgi:hypothetical protein
LVGEKAQRVPIRRRCRARPIPDHGVPAGLRLDDDRLPPFLSELFAQDAHEDVVGAACSHVRHGLHRPRGIDLCIGDRATNPEKCGNRNAEGFHEDYWSYRFPPDGARPRPKCSPDRYQRIPRFLPAGSHKSN